MDLMCGECELAFSVQRSPTSTCLITIVDFVDSTKTSNTAHAQVTCGRHLVHMSHDHVYNACVMA